jgi:uncharacterized membrane protein
MADKPMVVLVATYSGVEAAEDDYKDIMALHRHGDLGHIAAAILLKDTDGELKISRHDTTSGTLAWTGGLVGALLTIIAPPVGLTMFAGSIVASAGVFAGLGGIAGHYWKSIPKKDLQELGDTLDAGQAALVVVAVDRFDAEIDATVARADKKTIKKMDKGDVEGAYGEAVLAAAKSDDKVEGA